VEQYSESLDAIAYGNHRCRGDLIKGGERRLDPSFESGFKCIIGLFVCEKILRFWIQLVSEDLNV
jgi:hypothetical protein